MLKKYLLLFVIVFCAHHYYINAEITSISPDEGKKDLAEKYFVEGLNSYLTRDYKQAVDSWKKVLEIEPFHSRAMMYMERSYEKAKAIENHYYAGVEKYKSGQYKTAKEHFEKVLLINPKHSDARKYLNLIYEKLNMRVKIVKERKKDAEEIKEIEMTTDEELKLFAIGFDSKNNYLGSIDVAWETTGNLDPLEQKQLSSELSYAPFHFNTEGTIKATPEIGKDAATGLIKIKQGRLNSIEFQTLPKGKGQEINSLSLISDNTTRIYSAGYDKNNEYINDVPVDWIIENGQELNKQENTSSALLRFKKVNIKNKIIAKSKQGFINILTNIELKPGKLNYIRIESAPDGKGEEIYSETLTTDDVIKYYAVGYDSGDNFVGNISVNCKTTFQFKDIEVLNKSIFIYEPDIPGKMIISLNKENIFGDSTGIIEIKKSEAKYIALIDKPSKDGKKIDQIKLKAGEQKAIYAAGFSMLNKFVDLNPVDWKIEGNLPPEKILSQKGIELIYTNAPDNGMLNVKHPHLSTSSNIPITIIPDQPFKIVVSPVKEYNKTDIIYHLSTSVDQPIVLYAYLVDQYYNLIKKIPSEWKLTDDHDSQTIAEQIDYINFIPAKPGFKNLELHDSKYISDKIKVEIKPGDLSQIVILKDTHEIISTNLLMQSSVPTSLQIHGADSRSNFIAMVPGDWHIQYQNTNYTISQNVSSITLQFNQGIDQGVITFKNEQFQRYINFNVISTQKVTTQKAEELKKEATIETNIMKEQVSKIYQHPDIQESIEFDGEELLSEIIKRYYDRHRYIQAIEELDKMVDGLYSQELKNQALLFIGRSYFHIGEYRLALQIFSSLLEVYPDEALFWLNQVYKKIK